MFRSFVIVIVIILLCGTAFTATYQVGATKPYPDLQSVTSFLQPGDIVEVDGDATYPGGVTFTEPGASGNPITILGIRINGNRPILSGGVNTVHFQSPWPYTEGADHYILQGFDITGGSSRGIFHQAADLTIRDTVVHDCPAHGILGADEGSGSLTLEYSEVYNCGNGSSQHQIYMATDETNHPGSIFRMQYCYVHDGIGGNNIKSRSERNEIYYNWIEGAYYHELEMIGADGAPTSLAREDSDVVGNVFWKRNTFYITRVGGDGTGETYGRYRFVNNVFIAGSSAVFRLFDGIESIEMHNNVFYRLTGEQLNVIRSVDAQWGPGGEQIAGSNNWIPNNVTNIPAQWTDTLQGADPGFEDISSENLRPVSGSPLLNTGTNSPTSPPGYDFPSPLFPPGWHPPEHEAGLPGSAEVRPTDGLLDIGAFEAALIAYVDDSNTTGTETGTRVYPYNTIQEAVDAAVTGTTISVAQGNYNEYLLIEDKTLTLLGGFPGGTPADYTGGFGGDFVSQNPDTYPSEIQAGVLLRYTGASNSVIDGFTVTGGDHGIAIDDDLTWPLIDGVTISRNIIQGNGPIESTGHLGGGLWLTGNSHHITGNTIRNNNSGRGAGIAGDTENTIIENNLIAYNTGYGDHGGGLYLSGSQTIQNNVIEYNRIGEYESYGWGGGIVILGTADMSGNIFRHNFAYSIGGGIFIDEGANAELRNELIYRNTTIASDKGGAGVYVDGGAGPSLGELINCTLAYNTAPGSSGGNGVYVEGLSTAVLTNCILWGNSNDDFYHSPDSSISVSYSLSQEVWPGSGNINIDPDFAESSSDDYHLKSTTGRWVPLAGAGMWVTDSVNSPAIDMGDPGSAFSLEPVPNGYRINMGAYGNTSEASKSGLTAIPALSLTGLAILAGVLGLLVRRKKNVL